MASRPRGGTERRGPSPGPGHVPVPSHGYHMVHDGTCIPCMRIWYEAHERSRAKGPHAEHVHDGEGYRCLSKRHRGHIRITEVMISSWLHYDIHVQLQIRNQQPSRH